MPSAMTLIFPTEITCSNCGTTSRHTTLASTNQLRAPDLDLRPSEMMRSTMSTWLQECPRCGLIAPSLDAEPPDIWGVLSAPAYRAALDDRELPDLARRFVCRAIIEQARADEAAAGQRYLEAAWVMDDKAGGDYDEERFGSALRRNTADVRSARMEAAERARELRRKAAECFEAACGHKDVATDELVTMKIKLVDVLRRAAQWDAADRLCALVLAQLSKRSARSRKSAGEAARLHRRVLIYESDLIGLQDDKAHTLDEAGR
jgi:hypothetical protein